jgi:hypothetical protein
VLSLLCTTLVASACWFMRRSIKIRNTVIKQIEEKLGEVKLD